MPSFCTNCDIRGEKATPGIQGSFTLESCKQACRDNLSYYGIDFGHSGSGIGKCYMTTVPLTDNGCHGNAYYSGYKKEECSTGILRRFYIEVVNCSGVTSSRNCLSKTYDYFIIFGLGPVFNSCFNKEDHNASYAFTSKT